VVIAISGSGNSPNVLKAMQVARAARAITAGLTGFQGGKLKDLVDYCIIVPSDEMKHIEDAHLILEHGICHALREMIAET
jgi:D-sedoheptulose 7-phosphate isomerase